MGVSALRFRLSSRRSLAKLPRHAAALLTTALATDIYTQAVGHVHDLFRHRSEVLEGHSRGLAVDMPSTGNV